MKIIVKIEDEAKQIFFVFRPFLLNLTLVLAILVEISNPEFGKDWLSEYEEIDPRNRPKSSKSCYFGRNWAHIMIDFFIFSR